MDIGYLYYHTVLTISPPFNLFVFVERSKKKKKKKFRRLKRFAHTSIEEI